MVESSSWERGFTLREIDILDCADGKSMAKMDLSYGNLQWNEGRREKSFHLIIHVDVGGEVMVISGCGCKNHNGQTKLLNLERLRKLKEDTAGPEGNDKRDENEESEGTYMDTEKKMKNEETWKDKRHHYERRRRKKRSKICSRRRREFRRS